ncbi:XRE family transcriptional regulator [Actinocorallia longicatena]|uniref:XRE family transcriptional regulator n=1 Tax=Actinocorallia longicatena TaxID=111803 RepID=A0ABP6PZG7_9ACTN
MNDDAVAEAVARTLRAGRATHGWSLDQLAARSGVSKGVLVNLEQARGNPSLGTLIKISEALGIPLTRLVSTEDEPVIRFFPPDRQVTLWHGPSGGTGTLLAGSDGLPTVELWTWRLLPGEARNSEPHPQGTREIVHTTEGTLTVFVDGHPHTVPEGTAAVLVGDRPHGYANTSTAPCVFTMAVMDS